MCDLVDLSVIVCDFCVFAQSNVIVFDDITFDFLYKSGAVEGCKSHTLTRLSFRPVGLWSVLFSLAGCQFCHYPLKFKLIGR